ncbi:hypothetical protein FZEAL_8341 [Fusarium zealandicum]|uniref:Uncharacterized protein n=1 Tax=Fusarium zealandicum TaxID=1053134 RepID=A0A8H4XHL2_9HYPO|nr:hypothetical protein FZEAL_8341 [Fusarium zealandicum]
MADIPRHEDEHLSCPYRELNCQVFNLRDYPSCANKSYPNVTVLKRHITTSHLQKEFDKQCPTYCYERGITEHMEENLLRARRKGTRVMDWDDIWKSIFPICSIITDRRFVPIAEGLEAVDSFFCFASMLDPVARERCLWILRGPDLGQALREIYNLVIMGQQPMMSQRLQLEGFHDEAN